MLNMRILILVAILNTLNATGIVDKKSINNDTVYTIQCDNEIKIGIVYTNNIYIDEHNNTSSSLGKAIEKGCIN